MVYTSSDKKIIFPKTIIFDFNRINNCVLIESIK